MKRQALLVGSFVLLAIALAVVGVLWLGGSGLFTRQVPAVLYLGGNVTGLNVGAPVTFRGVPVGRVESVDIEVQRDSLDALIEVRLRLRPESVRVVGTEAGEAPSLSRLVQRGLRAQLVLQSLVTGQKQVELDFAPNTAIVLRGDGETPEIPALPDRFGALVQQIAELPLSETVQELRTTLQALHRALDGSTSTLDVTAKQLGATLAEARTTLATTNRALIALQARTDTTLAAVTRLADNSNQTLDAARPELQRSLVGVREASAAARVTLQRINDMTAAGSPTREDLDAALRDLAQSARGLRAYVELLEDQPNAVIFGDRRR